MPDKTIYDRVSHGLVIMRLVTQQQVSGIRRRLVLVSPSGISSVEMVCNGTRDSWVHTRTLLEDLSSSWREWKDE